MSYKDTLKSMRTLFFTVASLEIMWFEWSIDNRLATFSFFGLMYLYTTFLIKEEEKKRGVP